MAVVFQVVFHCEGVQTNFMIRWFSVNLVCTGAVTSQLSVQKGQKCSVQVFEAVDINAGDHFVKSASQVCPFN